MLLTGLVHVHQHGVPQAEYQVLVDECIEDVQAGRPVRYPHVLSFGKKLYINGMP